MMHLSLTDAQAAEVYAAIGRGPRSRVLGEVRKMLSAEKSRPARIAHARAALKANPTPETMRAFAEVCFS